MVGHYQGTYRASGTPSEDMAGEVQSLVDSGTASACISSQIGSINAILIPGRLTPFASNVGAGVGPRNFFVRFEAACFAAGLREERQGKFKKLRR